MKKLIALFILINQNLLKHYLGIVKVHRDAHESLKTMMDAPAESAERGLDQPDFLSKKQEIALVHDLLSGDSENKADGPLPKHISITFIMAYLNISSSTFYRQVHLKQLKPVNRIGNRPYYLLADLIRLMEMSSSAGHEKGSWTFARMNR